MNLQEQIEKAFKAGFQYAINEIDIDWEREEFMFPNIVPNIEEIEKEIVRYINGNYKPGTSE
jgi:hypothetical protein